MKPRRKVGPDLDYVQMPHEKRPTTAYIHDTLNAVHDMADKDYVHGCDLGTISARRANTAPPTN